MKPWLLEINHTPSLAPETSIGNFVKSSMIHELFNLVDIEGKDLTAVDEEVERKYSALQEL
jgi:hypothetical protein